MAGLEGGKYITFGKPYLRQVAEIIEGGNELTFTDGVKQKINMTSSIKEFLTAFNNGNENSIATILKPSRNFSPLFNGYKWSEIEKSQFTGRTGGSDAETTAKQERATMFAIQMSIENNGYTDQTKFYKLYRNELLDIYPEMDEKWEDAIFQQQLTTYREVGSTRFGHYSRDDGFMKYITDRCKSLYGISKKDTWNPADIWLVSDLDKVKRDLDRKILDNTTSLAEFNTILRQMFHDRRVVGISLKLISGSVAKWELVNLENDDVFDGDQYTFGFQSSELLFSLRGNEFTNTDSKLIIGSSSQEIKFQIRQNSAGFNNLKIEGTDIGNSAARLGKVPLDMGSQLFAKNGLESTRWRSWRNYPQNVEEFNKEKDLHITRFKKLSRTRKVSMGVRNAEEFSNNVTKVFENGKKDIANSKLIQLDLFCTIFGLQEKKLNNLLTDMAYLAQKKGTLFGPFAKLY